MIVFSIIMNSNSNGFNMKRRISMKKILVLIIVLSLVLVSVPAFAETDEAPAIIGDVLVARPLGLVGLVAGTGLFVISLPFAAITGSIDKTSQALVVKPAEFTFSRPVGNFD